MLNEKIQDAFNKQLNAELYSSYLYLSMSAHFEAENLAGMANWMRIQAQEELTHVMKFFDFINERDGRVTLTEVAAPQTQWKSPLDAFEGAYEHECKVTGLINELADLAIKQKDHAANAFLQWFITEQVEEESAALMIVDKLKLAGDNGVALFMLDGELGQRTFVPPTPTAA
ncbi:MAG: ferritin [Planctomycetes bacterium RBG_16_64_12]|nr:MAG: ferritin [Planctomycetes bacterium RBG_16_64_12]